MTRLTAFSMSVLACVMLLGAAPVLAAGSQPDSKPEKLKLVWPDPTPEELALLPRDGCKELEDIQKPDESKVSRGAYLAWTRSPDGLCWDWYSRNFDRAYVLGDTPPPGARPPPRSALTDEMLESKPWLNKEPFIVEPAGSHPTERPGHGQGSRGF
jgi:hypothetical protein